MKKQSAFKAMKTVFGKLLFATIVFASSPAFAQSIIKEDVASKDAKIEYLGSDDEMFLFNVHYNNTKGDKFIIEVLESSDNVLFKEIYTDKEFNKKFKIPKDLEKLSFVIKGVKDKSKQVFLVNSSLRTYHDVVVRRVN